MTDTQKRQCSVKVGYSGWHGILCSKPAVVERDGKWYCKIHDPEYIKAKNKAKQAKDKINSCSSCGRLFRESWFKYCPLCGTPRYYAQKEDK